MMLEANYLRISFQIYGISPFMEIKFGPILDQNTHMDEEKVHD